MNYDSDRDAPLLRAFTEGLCKLFKEVLDKGFKIENDDHFGFMSLCFAYKQDEHLKAVNLLVDNGLHRDACVIARTMIEGFGILACVCCSEDDKAYLWRAFAVVEDYKTMLSQEKSGIVLDPSVRNDIYDKAMKYGEIFFSKAARNSRDNGNPLPENPFVKDWAGKNASEMFSDAGLKLLYDEAYRFSSQWIHWTCKGLGEALKMDSCGNIHFSIPVSMYAATSLACAFQAGIETLRIVEEHFSVGFKEEIEDLCTRYREELMK